MLEHPLRRQVVGEMHLRQWPSFALPCLILQWVRMAEVSELDREAKLVAKVVNDAEDTAQRPHISGVLDHGISVAWERHSEGSTLTIFCETPDAATFLDPTADQRVITALSWAEGLPGKVLRATRIWAVKDDAQAQTALTAMQFSNAELVSCHLKRQARIWSDFRIKEDGYGRLVAAANGCEVRDFTRLVHRLQELGNYRNRALLGLPVAKENWLRLDKTEGQLRELAEAIADGADTDDNLLTQLSRLSVELTAITASVEYRMSATAAYSLLVDERLQELDCTSIAGFASLADFTKRRFLPAVRTCAAFTARERRMSQRAGQITSLLRTRIETRIENQNAKLLRSMESSASMQLRLQQLVEGLSVVALSYYLLGLASYGLKGLGHDLFGIDAARLVAFLVAPVLVGTWLAMRIAKRRLAIRTDA